MKNTNKLAEMQKRGRINRRIAGALMAIAVLCVFSVTAGAAGDTDVVKSINNMSDLFFAIIKAVGGIAVGFGVIAFATSFWSHDTQQRMTGVYAVIGGLILLFAKSIVNFISG